MKKSIALLMAMVMLTAMMTVFNAGATERKIPSAIVTDFQTVLYVNGNGELWCYYIAEKKNEKLLDDVIHVGQGVSSMNFFAIRSNGELWSWNVNYQDNFELLMTNIVDTTSTSFQDFANFAVTKDGKLLSWGSTDADMDRMNCMGFEGYDGSYIEAANARVILEDVKSVSANGFNVVALKNDGTLWRWGLGQITPDNIAEGIVEIVDVASSAIFGLKENGNLFAWYLMEDEYWGAEESFLKEVKEMTIAYEGMAYIDFEDNLWVGYELDDFGETHFTQAITDAKEVVMPEVYLKNNEIPVFVLKNDNTLWCTGTLSADEDYLPWEDDFVKVMDNVDSFYVRGEACTIITKSGELYLTYMNGNFNKVRSSQKIAQVSDFTSSDWAVSEIARATELNLLSADMKKDYKANISRVDFCEILTKTLEAKTGKSINQILSEKGLTEKKYFNDTDSEYVDYMCRLGIVTGVGDKLFDPYAKITREAAAVMLTRAAKVLGFETSGNVSTEPGISAWAAEGVGFVTSNGIMNGTGTGFDPQGKFTKEQAIATFVRLYNK